MESAILEVSNRSWATVDKSKLPRSSFLWVEDPNKKDKWHLPIYEGGGGVDPATGMYRSRGELNLNGLRAASAAISGARTGQGMRVPANVRSRITGLLKTHKIGQFAESKEIVESGQRDMLILSSLQEASVDRENKVIRGVALLGPLSSNKRRYTDECFAKAKAVFEGAKAYLNHKKKLKTGEVRDVRELMGRYQNVDVMEGKLKGDWHLLDNPYTDMVMSIAERMPDIAGNSIHAEGKYHLEDGIEVIEELTKVFSVDLVTDPATTSSLFESIDKKEESDMDWKDITLATLRENRADISEAILDEGVKSRDEEVKTLTEENKGLKGKVDEFEVKEATAAKSVVITKLLTESGLSKEALTDTFRETCVAVEEKKEGDKVITVEEQIKVLIDDRKAILDPKGVKHNTEKTVIESGDVSKEDFAFKLKR